MVTVNPALNPRADEAVFISAEHKYTNVPLLPSLLVALIGGSTSIALAYLLKEFLPYLYALILERSPIQFLTLYAFWFTMGLLIFKYRNLQRERAAFNLDFIQSFTAGREVLGTQTILSQHRLLEENLDPRQKDLILVSRINKAIKQIRINTSPADVARVLTTVAETDATIIDSSYILLKYMIWVIPIQGFTGTVMGMTQAIGSFDTVIKQISDIGFAGVQQSLGLVTGGLAMAFDTTFLALVLCAIANLFTNSLQKKEEDLLSDVEEFTTDNIINKYSSLKSAVAPLATAAPPNRPEAEAAGQAVMRELKNMNKQQQVNAEALLAPLGQTLDNLQGQCQQTQAERDRLSAERAQTQVQNQRLRAELDALQQRLAAERSADRQEAGDTLRALEEDKRKLEKSLEQAEQKLAALKTLPLQIKTRAFPTTLTEETVQLALAAEGGSPPYHWELKGTPPPGLSFNPNTGLISGVTQSPGDFAFTLKVTDARGFTTEAQTPVAFKVIRKFEEQRRKVSDWFMIIAGALALFFVYKLWQGYRVRQQIKEMQAKGYQLRWVK